MENKRVILAVVLSLVVLVGWNFLFPAKPPVPKTEDATPSQQAPAAARPETAPVAAQAPQQKAESLPAFAPTPGKMLTVDTPLYRAVLNSAGTRYSTEHLQSDSSRRGWL